MWFKYRHKEKSSATTCAPDFLRRLGPLVASSVSQWGFFSNFFKQANQLLLPYASPCLSTSFSLCTPSKAPPESYTGSFNTIYSMNFWAPFCISTSNKDRLVTQYMIFSKCRRAYLNKFHGNVHIAHLLKGIFFLEQYYPELPRFAY